MNAITDLISILMKPTIHHQTLVPSTSPTRILPEYCQVMADPSVFSLKTGYMFLHTYFAAYSVQRGYRSGCTLPVVFHDYFFINHLKLEKASTKYFQLPIVRDAELHSSPSSFLTTFSGQLPSS
jgi:hypothetical protein